MADANAGRSVRGQKRSGAVAVRVRRDVLQQAYAERVNRSKGMLLLGVWVLASNVLPLLSLRIPNSSIVLTLLGVVAGVLLLVDR
jgi:hypothetical protein